MEKVIEVKNLSKEFKIRTNKNIFTGIFNPKNKIVNAVNDISFEVNKGESLAFLGPNGAGKTTAVKIMTGLVYPTAGEINILGFKPQDRNRSFLKRIGLVMGNKSGLNWDLTPRQSFDLYQKIYELEEKECEKYLMELCAVLNVERFLDIQVRKLSLGERMKMELIGAILHNPEILFLDEPTIGLDIVSKKNIRVFLRELQKKSNITIVLTSHDMDDIEKVCDRVIVVNQGKKVYDDTLDNLVKSYNKDKFIKCYFENAPKDFSKINYATVEHGTDDSVVFKVSKELMPKLISDLSSQFSIIDVDMVSVPLEDIIEDLYKK